MRYFRGIFDRILLRQKTTKATTADDNLVLFPGKVLPDAFNVVHQLIERVRLGARTLPVTSIVKREDAPFVTQRTECFEVCSMIPCALLVSSTNVSARRMWPVPIPRPPWSVIISGAPSGPQRRYPSLALLIVTNSVMLNQEIQFSVYRTVSPEFNSD